MKGIDVSVWSEVREGHASKHVDWLQLLVIVERKLVRIHYPHTLFQPRFPPV